MHFLHEDAMCERDLCMFKHKRKEENNSIEVIESNEDLNDTIETIIDAVDDEEIENEDVNENENESVNRTFSNPSQHNNTSFKCDECYFEAERKIDIMNHKKEYHNWCLLCFSTFSSQDKLKEHKLKNHNE